MSLPVQPNSIIGTRLMDLLSRVATSNEIATFGYSNDNTGVKVRLYDSNLPDFGALLGYSTSNYAFSLTRDIGRLNVGINTTVAPSAFYVAGDYTLSGTLITSNLVVTGTSSVPITVTTASTGNVSLFNPTGVNNLGSNYKNIITNDPVSSNCILMLMTLSSGKYVFNTTLSYTNLDPSFTTGTNAIYLGLYRTTVASFVRTTSVPLQSTPIYLTSTTDTLNASTSFIVDVPQATDYVFAVSGAGQTVQFIGTGSLINIGGFGTSDSAATAKTLQMAPFKNTRSLTSASNVFSFSTPGTYSFSTSSNVEVYRNGIKFAYNSPSSNDYVAYYTNSGTNTTFTVVTQSTLQSGDTLDLVVWPNTTASTFTNSYLYQDVYNQYTNSLGLNVNSNNGYVGIGTLIPTQQLSVVGQAYFSSNVGINVANPSSMLDLVSTRDNVSSSIPTKPLSIQQSVIGQEFPPVGISNIYFAPDYTDTYTSIDIGRNLSNLEYPPSAMNNYSTYLITTYGAGTYTASASSEYDATNYIAWRAFTKITNAYNWTSASGTYSGGFYAGTKVTYDVNGVGYRGEWLQIQLPYAIPMSSYQLTAFTTSATQNPYTWYILGSLDGINWTLLNTQVGLFWTAGTVRQFGIQNPQWYSYYRMVVLQVDGTFPYVVLNQWRLFTNTALGLNRYPKYKATIPYYTSTNTYGLGQYQIWANTIQDYSFSNQAIPSGLFNKTIGNTSNTVWASYSNVYTSTVDAPSSNLPIIYAQFPDALQLTSYSLTARGGNALETPSKWTLFGSNTTSNTAWQSVDTESGITFWSAFQTSNFTVATTNAYNFYKLELYRNSSPVPTRMSLGELRFYANKQTPESRMMVSTNGFVGIGTTQPQTLIDINGDLNIQGFLGDPILRTGPYVVFDGSSNAKNTFLQWMQYATSTEYRFKFRRPTELASSTWWNTNMNVSLYESYTYSTVGGAPGSYAYISSVLLADGRVLFVPNNSTTNIGIFNPSTNAYSTIPVAVPGTGAYFGGVLLPDGRVVFVPYNATTIGIFNPTTNTYSTIAGAPGGSAYFGGVLLPDGRVVFVPNSSTIGLFNPNTNIYSTISGLPGGSYAGGVLLPDGRVVFVPYSATNVGIFNPTTNLFTTIPTGTTGYFGGVLVPDGRIIFVPHGNTTSIGIFNPTTNVFTTVLLNPSPVIYSYIGGVLLPDGRVAFIPCYETTIGFFTPSTNTYSRISTNLTVNADNYRGGVLLPDGRVVFVPHNITTIGILTPTQLPRPPPLELCYHPCFNKL